MADKQMTSFRLAGHAREQLSWLAERLTGGNATEALELAVAGWTDALRRAAADNAAAFTPEEWCLVADVCNGTLWHGGTSNPAVMLAAEVEDGHRLNGSGYKWLASEQTELAGSLERVGVRAGKPTRAMRKADETVAALVKKLASLAPAHAWAMILAVTWFWRHCQDVDIQKNAWWQPAFWALHERQE